MPVRADTEPVRCRERIGAKLKITIATQSHRKAVLNRVGRMAILTRVPAGWVSRVPKITGDHVQFPNQMNHMTLIRLILKPVAETSPANSLLVREKWARKLLPGSTIPRTRSMTSVSER